MLLFHCVALVEGWAKANMRDANSLRLVYVVLQRLILHPPADAIDSLLCFTPYTVQTDPSKAGKYYLAHHANYASPGVVWVGHCRSSACPGLGLLMDI